MTNKQTLDIEKNKSQISIATHGSDDHPLKIGDIEIPCYVLEDGRRVLVLQGMLNALDMSQGTATKGGRGNRLVKFIETKALEAYVSEKIKDNILNPILFQKPNGTKDWYGYEATILADICDIVLEARKNDALNHQQYHIAERCEILVRGFARVGIIALVDEATGYQDFRSRQALEQILERFLSEELLRWAKRFPDEFYKELFRLRNWEYNPNSVRRPSYVGKLTNDLVYERLAPGVLDELRNKTPKDEKGRRKVHFHRWLTNDIGHPKLQEHLSAVIALMKASPDWNTFTRLINRALPKYDETLPLEIYDENGLPM